MNDTIQTIRACAGVIARLNGETNYKPDEAWLKDLETCSEDELLRVKNQFMQGVGEAYLQKGGVI